MKKQIILHDELEKDFDDEVKKDILKIVCGTLLLIFQFFLIIFGTVALLHWFLG